MNYRKKPVEVQAIQLLATQESILEINKFIEGKDDININSSAIASQMWDIYVSQCLRDGGITIQTLESKGDGHFASFGDYVIKGVKGEFYACKPDIFEMTYEKA